MLANLAAKPTDSRTRTASLRSLISSSDKPAQSDLIALGGLSIIASIVDGDPEKSGATRSLTRVPLNAQRADWVGMIRIVIGR